MADPGAGIAAHDPDVVLRRTLMASLTVAVGQLVRVCGWLRYDGDSTLGVTTPVTVSDHTGTVPLVGLADDLPNPGSAVEVTGEVVPAAEHAGGIALAVSRFVVRGPAEANLPLRDDSSLAERLDWRYLDLRQTGRRLTFAVQTTLEQTMRAVWAEHDFIEVHSPKLMPTGPRFEDLFRLEYFDRRAWLAQSPQFYKQMAMAAGFDRVFEIGPVFRAEPRLSPVHATEFTSVDVEMAWIDSHEDVMAFAEHWLVRSIAAVAARHGARIEAAFGVPVEVPVPPFPRFTLPEAWEIVTQAGHPGRDGDLDRDAERLLAEHVRQRHGHEFVWITEYPDLTRPFYHMRCTDDSVPTRSFDLLWKGLEVASGAQREHRHAKLLAQAQERALRLEPIRHYLDFFRYGAPPHGGFGFGLSRLLMCLLGASDVREVTFLSRDRGRLVP